MKVAAGDKRSHLVSGECRSVGNSGQRSDNLVTLAAVEERDQTLK